MLGKLSYEFTLSSSVEDEDEILNYDWQRKRGQVKDMLSRTE